MFKILLKYKFVLLTFIVAAGCQNSEKENGKIVARVGSNKLSLDEISLVVPQNTARADSAVMASDYIKKWVKRKLLLQKAEENLSAEQKNVNQQLEEYRESLLIYKYKNAMMSQRMDTAVTPRQIENYYNSNPEKFTLNKNIVKAIFVKIPNEFANPDRLKEMCSNTSVEGIIELRDYCLQYAKVFDIFTERWVDFQLVAKNIPQTINDPEQFLQQNTMIERSDSTYYYLAAIQDYKLRNELAPLEFVEEKIKNLILNRRKIDFLKQLENNIYSEAVNKSRFKIYDTKANTNE